jgi:hypothetical protein
MVLGGGGIVRRRSCVRGQCRDLHAGRGQEDGHGDREQSLFASHGLRSELPHDLPGGFATVVCVKPVPVGAKDFVMCTDVSTDGHPFTKVKETEANCPDPSAPPAASQPETNKDETSKDDDDADDDDDAKADAKMKKMLKQGQDFIDRQKRK